MTSYVNHHFDHCSSFELKCRGNTHAKLAVVDCKADAISNALRAIKGGRTIRKAARDFDVPYGTLYNKLKGLHKSSYGGKRELPYAVEIDIVNILEFCAVMKAPIDGFDLRCIVQNLLNACNIKSKKFRMNMPGPDWLENFIKRHSLTKRIADNVKSARAEVTPDVQIDPNHVAKNRGKPRNRKRVGGGINKDYWPEYLPLSRIQISSLINRCYAEI